MTLKSLQYPIWGLALAGLVLLFASGCGSGNDTEEEPAVASYKDTKLTPSLLAHYIPAGVSTEDSMRYAKQFIEQWLKEQSIMDKALKTDPTLATKVEFKVRDYRAKLIVNTYETDLVKREMDKNIPMSEVVTYYEAHKDYFRSKKPQFCYFFLMTSNNSLSQPGSWMRSNSESDRLNLENWAKANAMEMKLDSTYVGISEIAEVSKGYYGNLQKAGIGKLIRWNGVIQGERRRYLFKMIDIVAEGDYLPVSLCKNKIRNLILNERKIKLIESTEEKILKNAQESNYIQKN
ncbi:MAG TPA: hypothetical protein ENJ82_05720 [Bacteroidetes bacterium]|nr:hypothetical protein [Bacteroidota bacterium]